MAIGSKGNPKGQLRHFGGLKKRQTHGQKIRSRKGFGLNMAPGIMGCGASAEAGGGFSFWVPGLQVGSLFFLRFYPFVCFPREHNFEVMPLLFPLVVSLRYTGTTGKKGFRSLFRRSDQLFWFGIPVKRLEGYRIASEPTNFP